MPKISGPLHSDNASGTLAGQLTFQTIMGRQIARAKPTPSQPATPSQKAHRATVKTIMALWPELNVYEQDEWTDEAIQKNLQGINVFFTTNFRLQKNGNPYTRTPPPNLTPFQTNDATAAATIGAINPADGTAPVDLSFQNLTLTNLVNLTLELTQTNTPTFSDSHTWPSPATTAGDLTYQTILPNSDTATLTLNYEAPGTPETIPVPITNENLRPAAT